MRYYAVVVEGTQIAFSSLVSDANNPNALNTLGGPSLLLTTGENNPNALRVAFTIEIQPGANSGSGSYIRLYGIPFSLLQQANTLAGKTVTLYAGFSPGLPLATAQSIGARTGMVMQGQIRACFGNWRGDDISLDLLVVPNVWQGQPDSSVPASPGPVAGGVGRPGEPQRSSHGAASTRLAATRLNGRRPPRFVSPRNGLSAVPFDASISDAITSAIGGDFSSLLSTLATSFGGGGFRQIPANLIHNLLPNMPLSAAITQTLTTAFPGVKVKMNITSALQLAYQDGGVYQNLSQYAGYIKSLSASILSGAGGGLANQGVDIIPHGNEAIVTDWIQPTAQVMLAYTDLIGQPTWTDPVTIQFSSVLRADLYPTVAVSFPQTLFGVQLSDNAQGDSAPLSGQLTSNQNALMFNGTATIQKVRHVGDSRSPDGAQWRTDCWAVINGAPQAAADAAEIANVASGFYGAPGGPGDTGGSSLNARFSRRALRYYR